MFRGLTRKVQLAGAFLRQPSRTVMCEEHHIYRPTDGQPITFTVFITDDPWGEFDITRSIIMLPSWFGPTDDMKATAQQIADNTNWRVFLPNIYGGMGKVANTVEEAQTMFNDLDYAQTVQDVGWLARKLRSWQPGSGVATLGFSAGGAIALEAAATSDDISSAVSFYGLPPSGSWQDLTWSFKKNNKAMHVQFGASDSVFSYSEAEEFRQLLKHNDNKFQFYTYPHMGHNFMEDQQVTDMMDQPTRSPQISQLAMVRACKFLLENTPKYDLDELPDEFYFGDAMDLAPNDTQDTNQWKEY